MSYWRVDTKRDTLEVVQEKVKEASETDILVIDAYSVNKDWTELRHVFYVLSKHLNDTYEEDYVQYGFLGGFQLYFFIGYLSVTNLERKNLDSMATSCGTSLKKFMLV